MLVHGDIAATTSCAKLTCTHTIHQIGALWVHSVWQQLLYSCSRYFGAKCCFLLNNTWSRKSRLFSGIKPFCLQRHALHMLIKYLHMLICICVGEGSRHFSAILLKNECPKIILERVYTIKTSCV